MRKLFFLALLLCVSQLLFSQTAPKKDNTLQQPHYKQAPSTNFYGEHHQPPVVHIDSLKRRQPGANLKSTTQVRLKVSVKDSSSIPAVYKNESFIKPLN